MQKPHRSIQSLSSRVGVVLNDIRLKDRFEFENTELEKRQVTGPRPLQRGL